MNNKTNVPNPFTSDTRSDLRFDGVNKRLDGIDSRLDKLEQRVEEVEHRIDDTAWQKPGAM